MTTVCRRDPRPSSHHLPHQRMHRGHVDDLKRTAAAMTAICRYDPWPWLTMVKFPTISCTGVMLMILKELQWPWLARTHHGEVPHHLLHQGAHGGHIDDLEVVSVDGPIGVHVLANLMQDAQQCHVGLSSTLLKQIPYTKGLSNTLMLTSYQTNVDQSCPQSKYTKYLLITKT